MTDRRTMILLPSGRSGDDRFALALETCRLYLLAVANAEMPARLAAKAGPSDLVQTALTAAYLGRARFRGHTVADLRAWLRGILANELADFRRHHAAACRDAARELPLAVAAGRPAAGDGPADRLVRAEQTAALRAAVAALPDDARQVLALRLDDRLGYREIGDRLGRSEEAVRKLFARALAQLRGAGPAAG